MIYNGSSIYRKDNKLKKFSPTDQYKNQIDYFSDIILKQNQRLRFHIGTSEVKLVELDTVNDGAVLSKIHCKSTWKDLDSFDPEKLEKSN